MINSKIIATGNYTPSFILTNEDISKFVDTNDEWIVSRTGIKERRIATEDDTSDIGTKAALEALRNSGLKAEDIDLIIFASITGEMLTPSMACIVQKNIGAINATAFDINAACSGFIYGLTIAHSLISIKQAKNALVIGAEVLSKIVNWEDRNTCVLFGDGAGAAVVSASEEKGILSLYTKSVGEKGDSLECGALSLRNPFAKKEEIQSKDNHVIMDGREVFKFATSAIIEAIEKVISDGNCSLEEVKYIIPHQANYRIIDFASRKLNIPLNKFYINVDKYGNTSAASIPIALHEMNNNAMLQKGDKIVMVGFGGGLTYGAALIEW